MSSVTRVGDVECSRDKVSYKSSPNIWQLFGLFVFLLFKFKLLWLNFGNLETIGLLFIKTNGHTGCSSVGRAVASDNRDLQFKSNHHQKNYDEKIYC